MLRVQGLHGADIYKCVREADDFVIVPIICDVADAGNFLKLVPMGKDRLE
jgi:hypothetical protein